MAIERYGSKMDIAVKLVLVFFVCLLSFSVGTFVGKKFSDNQHRLAQFEPTSHERDVASTHEGSHEEKSSGNLSDEEIAKLAEEFVSDDEHTKTAEAHEAHDAHSPTRSVATASEKPSEEHPAHPTAAVAAPDHAAPSPHTTPTKAPASTEKKEVVKKVEAHPAPEHGTTAKGTKANTSDLSQKIADSAVGKYTVQVGSFPSEVEARKQVDALKAEELGAFYVRADVVDKTSGQSKTWYRVSIGLFPTSAEADAYKSDLIKRSKVSSAIIQKITK